MLRRLEEALRHALEAPFASLFPQTVQPLEMAQALHEALVSARLHTPAGTVTHNRYTLWLSATDYEPLAPVIPALERELAEDLRRFAEGEGVAVGPHAQVLLQADAELKSGQTRVISEFGARPSAVLEGVSGTGAVGQVWPLGESAVVGRGADCAVRLEDGTVSRHHAQIAWEMVQYEVRDLGSQNGTSVNGVPVTQSALAPGDLLEVGLVQLRLRLS